MDNFKEKLKTLKKSFEDQETDKSTGIGISPANQEAGLQAKLLARVIKIYEESKNENNKTEC